MTTETPPRPAVDTGRAVSSYVESLLDYNRNLIFTTSGAMRLACIAGWIQGVAEAGQRDYAEHLAACLADQLRYACPNDEKSEDYFGGPHPVRRCVLSDDGSRHGFSLLWYGIADRAKMEERYGKDSTKWHQHTNQRLCFFTPFSRWYDTDADRYSAAPYVFSYNGGLLWHGAGDNSFSVTLCGGDNPWSIHT
jgi:hypothetical protein